MFRSCIFFLVLFLSFSLNANNLDINDYKVKDKQDRIFYLSQEIDNVKNTIGEPDEIKVFEKENREKSGLDIIHYIYYDGIRFIFHRDIKEVIQIQLTSNNYSLINSGIDVLSDTHSSLSILPSDYKQYNYDNLVAYSFTSYLADILNLENSTVAYNLRIHSEDHLITKITISLWRDY